MRPLSIRIVSHCYAERLPQYASFLRYQISSLIDPPIPTTLAVCYCSTDQRTVEVLNWFESLPSSLKLIGIRLERDRIYPRCHGRDVAIRESTADVVWFTDVDYLFLGNCLQEVVRNPVLWDRANAMVYVKSVMINKTHAMGDELSRRLPATGNGLLQLDQADLRDLFERKIHYKAIGGVQIVRGSFAREHGYLRGYPPYKGQPFDHGSKDDRIYRKECYKHGSIIPIEAPGVYRLRHSQTTRRLGPCSND